VGTTTRAAASATIRARRIFCLLVVLIVNGSSLLGLLTVVNMDYRDVS
jgi:hypothetical protein